MQVIITLAGRGKRFSEKGFHEPKPIVSVAGHPAISYLIDSFAKDWSLIFVLAEHDRESALEKTILRHAPNAKVIYTPFSERGPIDTVLAAIPLLNEVDGVLVSYCDLAPVWSARDFEKAVMAVATGSMNPIYDMACVNYQGFHPTYLGPNSYCHVRVSSEAASFVTQLQEKVLFTDHIEKETTSAGIYYFKNRDLLHQALQEQLRQNLKYKSEFYISLALQAALNKNSDLKILDYRIDHLVQLGTPADTERFEFWYQYLVKKNVQKKFLYIERSQQPIEENSKNFEQEKQYWLAVFRYFRIL